MIFFPPVIVKYMEKHLNISKPCYSEQILPVHSTSLYRGSTINYLELHTTGQAPVNFFGKHIVQLYISKTKTTKNCYKGFMAYPLSQEFLCSPAKKKKEKKYMLLLFVVNLNNC